MKTNDNGVDRNMTNEEKTIYDNFLQTKSVENKAQEKVAADKTKAKQVVLDRLGITADEAALLLG
tara:strand:+ start:2199 stop:2393 length:195 start_codon:yes stop_codon:yes gene_type:complete